MVRRSNNTLVLIVVGLVIAAFIWYSMNNTSSKDSYESSQGTSDGQHQEEIEYVAPADSPAPVPGMRPDAGQGMPEADFQLIDVPEEEPAHQIGFGMGPGDYGSGRATSPMFG